MGVLRCKDFQISWQSLVLCCRTSSTNVPHKWDLNPGQPHPWMPPVESLPKYVHLPNCTTKAGEVILILLKLSPRPRRQLQPGPDPNPWAITPASPRSSWSWPEWCCCRKMWMSLLAESRTRVIVFWRSCWPKSCCCWTLWRLRDRRPSGKPERTLCRRSRPYWTSWRRKPSELDLFTGLSVSKSCCFPLPDLPWTQWRSTLLSSSLWGFFHNHDIKCLK